MKSSTSFAHKLSSDDTRLIGQAKVYRAELRRQASELSDEKLAEKFEVSRPTIERIPEWRG